MSRIRLFMLIVSSPDAVRCLSCSARSRGRPPPGSSPCWPLRCRVSQLPLLWRHRPRRLPHPCGQWSVDTSCVVISRDTVTCSGEPIAPLLNTNPAQTAFYQASQVATAPANFPVPVVDGQNVAPGTFEWSLNNNYDPTFQATTLSLPRLTLMRTTF